MAPVNPMPPGQAMPDYTGASRGVPVNTAWERLFTGLGDVVGMYGEGKNRDNLNAIRESVEAGYDLNNQIISREAVMFPVGTDAPAVPDNVALTGEQLATLHEARMAGNISENHYWARMQNMVQSLRQRYPGYRREIDQMVSEITGGTPANILRENMFAEAEAARAGSSEAADDWTRWVDAHGEEIRRRFPEFDMADVYAGRYDPFRIKQGVFDLQADEANIAYESSVLSLEEARGASIDDRVEELAIGQTSIISQRIIDSFITAGQGAGGQNFIEQITTSIEAGGTLDPGLVEGFKAQLVTAGLRLESDVRSFLNSTMIGEGPEAKSYAQILGPDRVQKIVDQAMDSIKMFDTLLTDGETGLIGWNLAFNESLKNADVRSILTDPENEPIRIIAALDAIGGTSMVNWALMEGPLANDVFQSLRGVSLGRIIGGSIQTVNEAVQQLERAGVDNPEVVGKIIEDMIGILTNPAAPPEVAMRAAEALFAPANDRFFASVDADQRLRLYNQLLTPEVQAQMEKIRATNPDLYDAYAGWATNGFLTLFRQSGETVAASMEQLRHIQITWNPSLGQFEYTVDPRFMPSGGDARTAGTPTISGTGNPLTDYIEYQGIADIQNVIEDLNKALASFVPIMESSGLDPAEQQELMTQLIRRIGVDPEARFQAPWYAAIGAAVNAAGTAVMDATGAVLSGEVNADGSPLSPEAAAEREAGIAAGEEDLARTEGVPPLDTNFINPPTEIVGPTQEDQGGDPEAVGNQGQVEGEVGTEVAPVNPMDTLPSKDDGSIEAPLVISDDAELDSLPNGAYFRFNGQDDLFVMANGEVQLVDQNGQAVMQYAPSEFDRQSVERIFDILENRDLQNLDEEEQENVQASLGTLRSYLEQGGGTPEYWDSTSIDRAEGVNPTLMSVVTAASQISGVRFVVGVHGGRRSQAEQDRLVSQGVSRTRNSNHLRGNALDLIPINPRTGRPDPNWEEGYRLIAQAMKAASEELGVNVEWGYEKWGWDMPHWQVRG